jgi:hypothetical protein
MQTDIIFLTAFAVETIVYTAAVLYIAHIIKNRKKQPSNPQQQNKTTKQPNSDIEKLIEKIDRIEQTIQDKNVALKLQPTTRRKNNDTKLS